MKKLTKTLLLCSLLALPAAALASSSPGVSFVLKSGQKVSFAFGEQPVVRTGSDAVSVSVGGTERVSYPYSDVARIVFEDVESTPAGITLPQASGTDALHTVFTLSGNTLQASGLTSGERLSVYTLSGTLATSLSAGADGTATLHLAPLAKGTYVVRTQGGVSYKFINR